MSSFQRTLVATFDATAMTIFAFIVTGGSFDRPLADIVLWGSAAAAALCAMVIATGGPPELAWVAIGYILFAAVLAVTPPQLIVLSLAVALMPIVPRPRNSLALGLMIASITAIVVRLVFASL